MLLGLAAVAYNGALGNGYCLDDRGIVVDNPQVREGRWGEIFLTDYWSPIGANTGLYRPLTVASLALGHALFGGPAWGQHLINLLLHLLALAGVYKLASSLSGPQGGLLAGLYFGLHPALSEAVIGIVSRAELLSFCLGLGGVWVWSGLARRPWSWPHLAGLLALAAAPLAKENGICFALGLVLWGLWRHPRRRALWLGALGAGGCALGIKWLVLGQLQPSDIGFIDNPLAAAHPLVRSLNSFPLLIRYLRLLVFPWPLSADYSYNQIPVLEDLGSGQLWLPLLLVASLGWAIWLGVRRHPELFLWTLISGGALVLVSNLLVAGGTIFAERLLYLPAAACCLGMGWLGSRLPRPVFLLVAGGWCLATLPLLWVHSAHWKDDLSLFRRSVEVAPRSARVHYGLGHALHEQGDVAGAVAAYQRATRIYPGYAVAYYNEGAALLSLGREAEALASYRQAVQIRPNFAKALYAVAVLVQHLEGEKAALRSYQALLAVEPGHTKGVAAMRGILLRQGDREQAAQVVRRALAQRPDDPELRHLLEAPPSPGADPGSPRDLKPPRTL
ncbi:MAG: tetratricopeptide repeat protein [Candidatus Handelsmanbacteria bacterium]|nr:tetratricopeptide repeat protein [Candidatus Handelsmanbacteria bacterium]